MSAAGAGTAASRSELGVVAIGRNEGERLVRCLRSVADGAATLVYVDSGSSDGSIAAASACGAVVVQLDPGVPFTAARARNAGLRALLASASPPPLVQFVDGDCEVDAAWLQKGAEFLVANPGAAIVCGRRRERFPDASIYNRLCDLEWDTPIGRARACGGDAMMRVAALAQSGGFRDDLIAGEEPELGVRLRALGWEIWRIDAEMTLHDAAMTRFSQWWRRSARAGFAFAEGAHLHGSPPERHWVREARSARLWAAVVPSAIVAAALSVGPVAAWALLVYPLQVARLAARGAGPLSLRAQRAAFLVLGKFPEALGQCRYLVSRLAGRRAGLIEYK
jgi:GT2 family glycosyltransferase